MIAAIGFVRRNRSQLGFVCARAWVLHAGCFGGGSFQIVKEPATDGAVSAVSASPGGALKIVEGNGSECAVTLPLASHLTVTRGAPGAAGKTRSHAPRAALPTTWIQPRRGGSQ